MNYDNDIRDRTKKFAVRTIKLTKELKKNNIDYPLTGKANFKKWDINRSK